MKITNLLESDTSGVTLMRFSSRNTIKLNPNFEESLRRGQNLSHLNDSDMILTQVADWLILLRRHINLVSDGKARVKPI